MKFKRLATGFLSLLLGLSICSFTSKSGNDKNVENDNIVLNNENIENIGTLNEDLEVQLRNYAVTDITASFQVLISFKEDADLTHNYYVGYFGEGEMYLPGSLRFYVEDSNGDIVRRSAPLNKVQELNNYDGIGSSLGSTSLSTFCDIPVAAGETVLFERGVQLFNVFSYDRETRTADFENPTYVDCTYNLIVNDYYPTNYNVHDFFKLEYTGAATFSNFGAFSFSVEDYGVELYPDLTSQTSRAYRTNESDLEDGLLYIKSSLSFGGDTAFNIYYKDGSSEVIESTSKNYEITNGGEVVLLFEGVDINEVENIEIYDIYYQLVIFNTETNSSISRTNFSQRFGKIYTYMIDLVDTNGSSVSQIDDNDFSINFDLIVGLIFGISTLIFFGIVIPSYFYLKKKNRNDEFKRMNTKSYVTTATYGYLCIESLLLLITFITIRATSFNNALTVFNPNDTYIIVFGVASIILVGYFIRYFVIMVKNHREKKRRDQLNINQDIIDDGTLIVRK